MTQWSYYVAISNGRGRWNLEVMDGMSETDGLNHLGQQGWELVTILWLDQQGYYYMKRPKE